MNYNCETTFWVFFSKKTCTLKGFGLKPELEPRFHIFVRTRTEIKTKKKLMPEPNQILKVPSLGYRWKIC